MLLFWPCLWGLTLAINQTKEFGVFVKYIILFFIGSVLMRSAGCIFNDIADKDFDKKVDRTKNRPTFRKNFNTRIFCLYNFIVFDCFNYFNSI